MGSLIASAAARLGRRMERSPLSLIRAAGGRAARTRLL